MAEPCTADNGGQSRRACSRLTVVYPTSAIRHVLTVIVQQISLPEDVELVIQQLKNSVTVVIIQQYNKMHCLWLVT